MGRAQPYHCPAPGCNKAGKLSGVKQHYRDKHDATLADEQLEAMIVRGESAVAPAPYVKTARRRSLTLSAVTGGVLVFVILLTAIAVLSHALL